MRETREHVEGPKGWVFPTVSVIALAIATFAFLLWMHNTHYQDPKNAVNQHPSHVEQEHGEQTGAPGA